MSRTETYYSIISITDESRNIKKLDSICNEFKFSMKNLNSVDELNESENSSIFFLFSSPKKTTVEVSADVQTIKFFNPKAFIVVVLHKDTNDQPYLSFLKKSGASIVILEQDLFETSKVEFLSTQIIRSSFIPIKISELKLKTTVDFSIYFFMPFNKKYIKNNNDKFVIDEKWKKRIENKTTELYISREDLEKYIEYVKNTIDPTAEGIDSRCRAFFLNLQQSYFKLIILLCDKSEENSYQRGKELLQECVKLCSELLNVISTVQNPLEIVNNSVEGDFGSVERSPTQTAIAGIMALNLNLNTEKVMLSSLLNNIGLLNLPYNICKKIKEEMIDSFTGEEKILYQKHPIMSINLALSKRLPLDEDIKSIILMTHERFDRTGFPNKPTTDKLLEESQLIQFNEELDQRCCLKIGKERKVMIEEFTKMIETYLTQSKYSPGFLLKMKKAF